MSENNRGLQNTEYLSVTFDEIKQKLIERAETYYPETYKDFSKTSFGSLMFDLVSLVGEQLNFYTQFVANEGFIRYARTGVGLQAGAARANISLGNTPSYGEVVASFPIVVSADQVTADESGGYTVLADSTAIGPDGTTVQLLEDVIITPSLLLQTEQGNLDPSIVSIRVNNDASGQVRPISSNFSTNGSRPLTYYVDMKVPCVTGEIKKFIVDIGRYQQFLSIEVPDDSCTDIISVIDSEGNKYHEVSNLSINTVQKSVRYTNADTKEKLSKIIDFPVPRRFQAKEQGNKKFIEFGFGSEENLKISEQPADPVEFYLDKQSYNHVIDKSITPGRYLKSDKYGVAPSNTTLTITYRANTSENSNIAIGGIDQFQSLNIVFDSEEELGEDNMNFIRNNISCTNETPFNGVSRFQSTKEIALRCEASVGSQSRAVTQRDMSAMTYALPSKYGRIKKSSVYRDSKGLRKILNLYCVAEDDNGNLQKPSKTLKENLKSWINTVKMMTDRINVLDATILNLGLHLDITLDNKADTAGAMSKIREFLFDEITLTTPEIGQYFSIGEIEKILSKMPMIERINKVKVMVKNGSGYSNTRYDIAPNTAPDGSAIYMPEDFIWEIKNATDIIGTIK